MVRTEAIERLETAYLGDTLGSKVEEGWSGLCLSGGGYKACLFHIGSLMRLNETGLLGKIQRFSSVSGGTIAAAYLAFKWDAIRLDKVTGVGAHFHEHYARPLWRFCMSAVIDKSSIIWGVLNPKRRGSDYLERAYDKHLFEGRQLKHLIQEPAGPRFTFNSKSGQLNSLWRFTQNVVRNYRIGEADASLVPIAKVVAASSAFPPVLSPLELKFAPGALKMLKDADCHQAPYTERAFLMEGESMITWGLRRSGSVAARFLCATPATHFQKRAGLL